ncbi:BQ2448_1655 [Microbotryum intermedium]|uniref:BQ2448_1655 protein n=1 Tax=Microbotryum intermedium TaxID=269621 RepID=A0A238FDQ5_9BASI|nr:BQ2448_1655 [Microbotryum intermedium]
MRCTYNPIPTRVLNPTPRRASSTPWTQQSRPTTSRATCSPLSKTTPTTTTRASTPLRRVPNEFRSLSTVQQFRTANGNIKVDLKNKHTIGIAQSRGERPYVFNSHSRQGERTLERCERSGLQAENKSSIHLLPVTCYISYQEDAYSVASLGLPQQALKRNLINVKQGAGWSNDTLEGFAKENEQGQDRLRQVACFGVFDGHGGNQVAKYLETNLAKRFEDCSISDIIPTLSKYRAIGGYLRRYRGGLLDRFRPNAGSNIIEIDPKAKTPLIENPTPLSTTATNSTSVDSTELKLALDDMCVLTFLMIDNEILADQTKSKVGSVATLALLHSLDLPHALPFYASQHLSLTIAHLGDTRAILASASSGRAKALTETHHADSRIESERLRQSGTGLVTDSFGESRWGGTLANTRGLGDGEFKALGVIGEPEVHSRVLKGSEWSFLVLVSDGVTEVMSDQEIVDLVRGVKDPHEAAKKIVEFAEQVGAEDNLTCLVVPLLGWGKMGGVDVSASRREYRLGQMQGTSSRQKRM